MNFYGHDYGVFDFGFTDPTIFTESMALSRKPLPTIPTRNGSDDGREKKTSFSSSNNSGKDVSPPKHRHDGTSPLPLGMDWSPPPRTWEGRNSVWPHDYRTGWSYCVTIPSWTIVQSSGASSDPVVFYRVQVGIQSPKGITTTRGILRRFSDFLKLLSELKKEFPKKKLPSTPPKGLLRMKSRELLEERRSLLEDWLSKILSDIDLSRSATMATFIELEAAARLSFHETDQNSADANMSDSGVVTPSASHLLDYTSDSLVVGTSFRSDSANDSAHGASDVGTPNGRDKQSDLGMEKVISNQDVVSPTGATVQVTSYRNDDDRQPEDLIMRNVPGTSYSRRMFHRRDIGSTDNVTTPNPVSHFDDELEPRIDGPKMNNHVRMLSSESLESGASSARHHEISIFCERNSPSEVAEGTWNSLDTLDGVQIKFPSNLQVVFPSDERHKVNRVVTTMQQRLATAKTDMEDLIARLNQEVAVRQYLATKVKDLELELETTKELAKENLQQAILIERERFTQMQWDKEEDRRILVEMELKLNSLQAEKDQAESRRIMIVQEKETLQQELGVARQQLINLQKHHEELELKSKTDVRLLVKEIKSLRSCQSEMKEELGKIVKQKTDVEGVLQKESQRRGDADAANAKLLHECEILWSRLKDCSVNFLIEGENKLTVEVSTPSEAIDTLVTSDNRIGLLLAEAQLLAQDVENGVGAASPDSSGGNARTSDDELRKMLTDVFVDNARLRKQVNSIVRCALSVPETAEKGDEGTSSRKTVFSKFLDR